MTRCLPFAAAGEGETGETKTEKSKGAGLGNLS